MRFGPEQSGYVVTKPSEEAVRADVALRHGAFATEDAAKMSIPEELRGFGYEVREVRMRFAHAPVGTPAKPIPGGPILAAAVIAATVGAAAELSIAGVPWWAGLLGTIGAFHVLAGLARVYARAVEPHRWPRVPSRSAWKRENLG